MDNTVPIITDAGYVSINRTLFDEKGANSFFGAFQPRDNRSTRAHTTLPTEMPTPVSNPNLIPNLIHT
jgi:hypothetical protein